MVEIVGFLNEIREGLSVMVQEFRGSLGRGVRRSEV